MDLRTVMTIAGYLDYLALAAVAALGIYCVLMLVRQLSRRRFVNDQQARGFLDQLRGFIDAGDFDSAEKLCGVPQFWYRAAAVLARHAIANRHLPAAKLRQSVAARFDRDILSELDNLMAWINTVAKSAPMLGLLGTVVGMIGAFSRIAGVDHPDPAMLADDIAVALNTTALGLIVAVPMVLAANFIQVRIRRLEDSTTEQVQETLDMLETTAAAKAAPRRKAPAR